jgi:molecular chaperone DnaK
VRIDRLFFFFSGHGFHSSRDNSDYLIPQDGVVTSLEDTSVSFRLVVELLGSWKADSTFLFLDVCRAAASSGKGTNELMPVDVRSLRFRGMATFWSCSPGQKSYESKALKRGVFTHAISAALSSTGKCKTVYELNGYLLANVPLLSRNQGLPIQEPYCIVEPLTIENAVLISHQTFEQWQAIGPLGNEIRQAIPRAPASFMPPSKIYCGLDFGTSYSAIATTDREGNCVFIPTAARKFLMPSVVSVLPNLDYVTGWKALEYGAIQPESAIRHIKRHLGTGRRFNVVGRTFSAEYLASLIIRSLKTNAEDFLGQKIDLALVSVPAHFTIRQCEALLESCRLADLPVLRLVSEPSAASVVADADLIADIDKSEDIYVLDLGGGTFDVCVMEQGEGVWEIRASGGDRNLGGIDYDDAIFGYICSVARERLQQPDYQFNEFEMSQIRSEAERVKIALGASSETIAIIRDIEAPGKNITNVEVKVSRETFRMLTEQLDARIEECIVEAFRRSGVKKSDLHLILLTGQGAKIFTVAETISRLFPDAAIEHAFQENAVALGLGRYTAVLSGAPRTIDRGLLLDSLPMAVGIKCARAEDFNKIDDPEVSAARYSGQVGHIYISSKPEDNAETFVVMEKDRTIPTYARVTAGLMEPMEELAFHFIEIDGRGAESLIGVVKIPSPEKHLIIDIDVDSNRTILAKIKTLQKTIEVVQLNNNSDSLIGWGKPRSANVKKLNAQNP